MTVLSMSEFMAADLSALFKRDMPTVAIVNGQKFNVLLDDLLSTEQDAYGGAENIDIQRVHFQTVELPSIENGTKLQVAEKMKLVVSSVTSADGSELIVTVRGL